MKSCDNCFLSNNRAVACVSCLDQTRTGPLDHPCWRPYPPIVSTDQNNPPELRPGHVDRLQEDMNETLGRLAMINHRQSEERNAQRGMCKTIDKELRRVTCAIDEIAETVKDEPIISSLAGEIRESFDRIQDAILLQPYKTRKVQDV